MRTFRLLTVAMLLALFFSACKKEDANQQPTKPKLLGPAKSAVIAPDKITFTWEKSTDAEGEVISYSLAISNDSIVWTDFYCRKELFYTLFNDSNKGLSYPFEYGKKYYWKVIAESRDGAYNLTGSTESDAASFYTSPLGVSQLSETSGDGFVNLSWTDPEGLSKVEVTFSPVVSGIAQPIEVKAGVGKLELRGMENSTVYSFYVKAFNGLGHTSGTDTIKAMPLLPILVHDADFNIYTTVKIGTQTWLRENLRTTRWQDGSKMVDYYGEMYAVGSQSSIYGYYYSRPSSWEGKNPCPRGYHVPSDEEVLTLERYLGMPEADLLTENTTGINRGALEKVGNLIKSKTGWSEFNGNSGNGVDLYGLNILPAGYYDNYNKLVEDQGKAAYISTTTPSSFIGNPEYVRILRYDMDGIRRIYFWSGRYPIRCIKD